MALVLTAFNGVNLFLPYRGFFVLRRAWLRLAGLSIGNGVRIATGTRFYGLGISIGANSWVGPESTIIASLGHHVYIGANTDIGPGCLITTGTHSFGTRDRRAGSGCGEDLVIGAGTWVGARCVILPGARIGCGSVIAAGAVVTAGSYLDNVLLAGVPAVVKRELSP